MRAPPRWSVTEWADLRRFLSVEDSAEPGRYRSDRAAYQKEIQDEIENRRRRMVVLMLASQLGKTAMVLNALGRSIDLDPAPILVIQPTLQMAESFSKERLDPMLRDSPFLNDKVKSRRSRDSGNTLLYKKFPGGFIALAGANSPASLASRPVAKLRADEIDKYPVSAGDEGDPLDQAIQRTVTFGARASVLLVSTPTIKGRSRIEKAYLETDQRQYLVPCPHCGFFQPLNWEQIDYPGKGTDLAEPKKAVYKCIACDRPIKEAAKNSMVSKGHWQATAESDSAGFQLESLVSPWQRWSDTACDFEVARKDTMRIMVWTNLRLGRTFDLEGGFELDSDLLLERADESDYESGEIPEGALLLTAGVDVQGDRLECSVWGWGEGEQSWLISHYKFMGDPLQDDVWKALHSFLVRNFGPRRQRIAAICVDTGGTGGQTQDTYGQVRQRKRWYAIKGRAGDRPLVSTPSWVDVTYRGRKYQGHNGLQLYTIGVDVAKETWHSRIHVKDPGPKFINLPRDLDWEWCEGFCSEKLIFEHHRGVAKKRWIKIFERNEALDCAVYAYAAAHLAGLPRMNWDELKVNIEGNKVMPKTKKRKSRGVNPYTNGLQ